MEFTPSSSTTSASSDASDSFRSSDWELLRNAVKEPVREIIAVEVDTESRAREITGELVALDSSRPNRIIEVDPIKSEPSELLVAARETVGMWPSEPGLLLFLDVSRPHPGEDDARAAAFWQAMNMLREQWDALNCQAIFFLLPYNYRLLSSSADHLKRWMALKVHLLGRKIDTEELDSAPLTMGLVDPSFAKQTLQALEAQLTEAIKRGEPPETLVRRYYLPMFAQAVSLGDIGRAEHLQKSLEAVQIPENELSGWFNVTVNYELGRFRLDRAEEVAKQHLNWARDRKNLNQEAIALFNLGQVARARGDLDAAEQSCLKSLEIERDLGDKYGEARSGHLLGAIAFYRKDFDAAERWFLTSLAIDEKLGDEASAAGSYHQLALLAQVRRDFVVAERFYLKSLAISEKYGNLQNAAAAYHQLGMLFQEKGDLSAAEKSYFKSIEIKEKLGNENDAAKTYSMLGLMALSRHDANTAERWFRKSLDIRERLSDQNGIASTWFYLGTLASLRGDDVSAKGWLTKSLALQEKQGNRLGIAYASSALGVLSAKRRDFVAAERWYRQSLLIWEEEGDENRVVQTRSQLAQIASESEHSASKGLSSR
jgi:tetratricopeptide (TPR) repeat protein